MKRIRSTCLGLIVVLLSPMAANAIPILENGGFETGALDPWTDSFGFPIITSAEANTGIYSVSAFGGDAIRQDFSAISTSLISEVSFWVKRIGGVFDQYSFFYDDGTDGTFLVNSIGQGDDWTYFDVTANLAIDKNLIGFQIFGTSPGPAFIDDLLIDAVVPEPGTLALFGIGLAAMGLSRRRRKI